MQRDLGVIRSVLHCVSWLFLSIRSQNQAIKFFFEKQALADQVDGTLLKLRHIQSCSIASVTLSAPCNPSLSSSRDFLISSRRVFILSSSCRATTSKGVFSALTFSQIRIRLKSLGLLSNRSSIYFSIWSSCAPPPPFEPAWTSKIVARRSKHC